VVLVVVLEVSVVMAGVAAEALENLTSSLSLLVNFGKAILENAKHEAAGKN